MFRDDVVESTAQAGELVRVRDRSGRELGWAFSSSTSRIALRHAAPAGEMPAAATWSERARRALAWRRLVQPPANGELDEARREVFAESDDLPGLIVDRYGPHLVLAVLTAGAERLVDPVVQALREELGVVSVLARNDAPARRLEGLPRETRQLAGQTPRHVPIREGEVLYGVDPWSGQKTGAFLDQRANRLRVAAWARGRVLDVFCYDGGFALHAARRAEEVIGIDGSRPALARAAANAELSALRNVSWVEANAFEELRRLERRGERFELVVLDPPALAKRRTDVPAATRAYKEINLRAMRLLGAQGILVTSSCSYHMSEQRLIEVLVDAAADAGRRLRLVARQTQSADHPLRLGFPESHYLKCLVLAAVS